ncbi:glycosyltransferase family 39 protein, partial [Pseudanabaenaceae cyanobacterium LEGE 13415]|nr:glycosyltransferase family 39 protein [Pseudanabaenaceae cyanobacterium LEGE 13415]
MKEGKARVSFLKALMVQACLASLSVEVFSSIRALDFTRIALFWTLISAINCFVLWSRYRSLIKLNLLTQRLKQFQKLDLFTKLCISAVITIAFISLVTCLISPPTNYDSLTYHLTRVVRWIQNRSLEYTPTHNLRQIFFAPGASYLVTHLQLLARGDYFANCVQWVAYVGCIVGVSLITKQVAGDRSQSVSALICATIPMAIMQSTTTQNDLVTSLWLVCLAYFVFQAQLNDRLSLFWVAIALGLAIVTKPTGIIFGIPLFILFAVLIVRQRLRQQQAFSTALLTSFKYCSIVGLGSLLFVLPSWTRNL